ncbi:uncharacterized protein LOC125556681 [Nematostella vectensis]|uniref:uncharacterized protein LOC125556681 n=1 Tax=Nematostella vectensis TaxID=45351 RepID=UPI00207703E9|nr:uncharacterized protein LOC125556681 [Nematostella vectensis]
MNIVFGNGRFLAALIVLVLLALVVTVMQNRSGIKKKLKEYTWQESNIKILSFGDSLTAGTLTRGDDQNMHPYSKQLQELLSQHFKKEFKVQSDGLPGDRVQAGMASRLRKQLVRDKFDWIIILAGTNDLSYQYMKRKEFPRVTINGMLKSLINLHEMSQTNGTRTVVVTVPARECEEKEPICIRHKLERKKFNKHLRIYAEKNKPKTIVADVAKEMPFKKFKSLWSKDGLHFTEKGYDKLATIIFSALKSEMEKPITP